MRLNWVGRFMQP